MRHKNRFNKSEIIKEENIKAQNKAQKIEKQHRYYPKMIVIGATAAMLLTASTVFAASPNSPKRDKYARNGAGPLHGSVMMASTSAAHVIGTLKSISGSSITVNGRNNIIYVVDTTSATFVKGFGRGSTTTASIGDLVIGNILMIVGQNGTTATSTSFKAAVVRILPSDMTDISWKDNKSYELDKANRERLYEMNKANRERIYEMNKANNERENGNDERGNRKQNGRDTERNDD